MSKRLFEYVNWTLRLVYDCTLLFIVSIIFPWYYAAMSADGVFAALTVKMSLFLFKLYRICVAMTQSILHVCLISVGNEIIQCHLKVYTILYKLGDNDIFIIQRVDWNHIKMIRCTDCYWNPLIFGWILPNLRIIFFDLTKTSLFSFDKKQVKFNFT